MPALLDSCLQTNGITRKMRVSVPVTASLMLLALASLSCSGPQALFTFERELMHTGWSFSIVASDETRAKLLVDEAAQQVNELDEMLAMWRPESELAKLNSHAGQGPQPVSQHLANALYLAIQARDATGEAEEPAVGHLVQLWYDALKKKTTPSAKAISEARKAMGPGAVTLEIKGKEARVTLVADARLDLGSVAKGYAQDVIAGFFRARGVRNFLMNAGGQVYASGTKPGGEKWRVGIMHPRENKVAAMIELSDQIMSTSGDYEQYTQVKGRRYHHIIDPKTGYPTTNGVASATVVLDAKSRDLASGRADSFSTPCMVLEPEAALKLAQEQKFELLLIIAKGKAVEFKSSPGFQEKLKWL